jgi:hypothetical protein
MMAGRRYVEGDDYSDIEAVLRSGPKDVREIRAALGGIADGDHIRSRLRGALERGTLGRYYVDAPNGGTKRLVYYLETPE